MRVAAVDLETSIFNSGNAFDRRNEVCFVGIGNKIWDVQYTEHPYGKDLKEIQQELDSYDLLVFVNAKFDLHHLRNLGINFDNKRIHDCQLVEFMLSSQTEAYPSMNSMAEKYGLPQKNDKIKEYWDKGVDTKLIPQKEIEEYLKHDLRTTHAIFNIQTELVGAKSKAFQRLVSLMHQDLIVLQEIEYNGFYFNEQSCKIKSQELTATIDQLRMELNDYHNIPEFNTESGDHLSALLYGGTIAISRKEDVGVYKTGERAGQVKYGWRDYSYTLKRQFNPLPRTELKKEGYWQTGEDVLKQLKSRDKAGKRLIEIILSLAKLEKMNGTYYNGLPKLRDNMNWPTNILHGNLNQVTARTGRLSSTKPNLQNISGDMKEVFETRFK